MSMIMQRGFQSGHHGFPSYDARTFSEVSYQRQIDHFSGNSLSGFSDNTLGSSLAASERLNYFGFGTGNPAMLQTRRPYPNSPAVLQGQEQGFSTSQYAVNYMLNSSMHHPAQYYVDPRSRSVQLLQSQMPSSHQGFSTQGQLSESLSCPAQQNSTSQYRPPTPRSVPQSWSTSTYNGALGYGSSHFPHSFRSSLPRQHPLYNEKDAQLYSKQMSAETFTGARHHRENPDQKSTDFMQISVEYSHAQMQSLLPRATPPPPYPENVRQLYHNRKTAQTLADARQQSSHTGICNEQFAGSIPFPLLVDHNQRQSRSLTLANDQCLQNGHETISIDYRHGPPEKSGHPYDRTFNETCSSKEIKSGYSDNLYCKVVLPAESTKSPGTPKRRGRPKRRERKPRTDCKRVTQNRETTGQGTKVGQLEHDRQANQLVNPVTHSSLVSDTQSTGVGSITDKRRSLEILAEMLEKLLSRSRISTESSSSDNGSLSGAILCNKPALEVSPSSHVQKLVEENMERRTNEPGSSHCGVDDSLRAHTGREASGGESHPAVSTEDIRTIQQIAKFTNSPILQTLVNDSCSVSSRQMYPKLVRLLGILKKLKRVLASDSAGISHRTQRSSINWTEERSVPEGTDFVQKSCQCANCPFSCDLHNPLKSPVQHEENVASASDGKLTSLQQEENKNSSDNKSGDEIDEMVWDLLERDVDVMKHTYESSGVHKADNASGHQITSHGKLPQGVVRLDADVTSDRIRTGSSPASLEKECTDIYRTCLACKQTFSSSNELHEHLSVHIQLHTNDSLSVDRENDSVLCEVSMDCKLLELFGPEPTENRPHCEMSFPPVKEQVADEYETQEKGDVVEFDEMEESVCEQYNQGGSENDKEMNVQNEEKDIVRDVAICQDGTVSAGKILPNIVSDGEEVPSEPRPVFDSTKSVMEEGKSVHDEEKGEYDGCVISEHSLDNEKHALHTSHQSLLKLQESRTTNSSHFKASALKKTRISKTKTDLEKAELKLSDSSHLKLSEQNTMSRQSCKRSYEQKVAHCLDEKIVSKCSVLLDDLEAFTAHTNRTKSSREKSADEKCREYGQCSYPVQCAEEEIGTADRESSSFPAEFKLEIADCGRKDVSQVITKKKSCLKKRNQKIIFDKNCHGVKRTNEHCKQVPEVSKNQNAVTSSVSGKEQKLNSSRSHRLDIGDNGKARSSLDALKDKTVAFPVKHTMQKDKIRGSVRTERTHKQKKCKRDYQSCLEDKTDSIPFKKSKVDNAEKCVSLTDSISSKKSKVDNAEKCVSMMDSIPSKKSKVDDKEKCVLVKDVVKEKHKSSAAADLCKEETPCSRNGNLCDNKRQDCTSIRTRSDNLSTDCNKLIKCGQQVPLSSRGKRIVNSLRNLFRNNVHLRSYCTRRDKSSVKEPTCMKKTVQESRSNMSNLKILETPQAMNESSPNETSFQKGNCESYRNISAQSGKENAENLGNNTSVDEVVSDVELGQCTKGSVDMSVQPVDDSEVELVGKRKSTTDGDHQLKDSVGIVSGDSDSYSQGVNDARVSNLSVDKSSAQGMKYNAVSVSRGVDNSVSSVSDEKSYNSSVSDDKDFIFCVKCMTVFTKRLVYNEHGCCQKSHSRPTAKPVKEDMDSDENEQDCSDLGKLMFDHKLGDDVAKTNPSAYIEIDIDSGSDAVCLGGDEHNVDCGLPDVVCLGDVENNQEHTSIGCNCKSKSASKMKKVNSRKCTASSQMRSKPRLLRSSIDKTNASGHAMFKCEQCDQNYSSRGGLLFHWQVVHRKIVG